MSNTEVNICCNLIIYLDTQFLQQLEGKTSKTFSDELPMWACIMNTILDISLCFPLSSIIDRSLWIEPIFIITLGWEAINMPTLV